MANSSVENVNTTGDKLMLGAAVVLVLAGIAGFYLLGAQALWIRVAVLLLALVVAAGVASLSFTGKSFVAFAKDAYREMRKVVWPSRKEAGQTTLIVFAFVLIMAIYLWVSDKAIEWAVFSLILGWR